MPATYEPIATTTLGSAASSITFSSIPATYTDLRVVFVATTSSTSGQVLIRYNGTTTTLYSNTNLYGTGSAAGSNRNANINTIDWMQGTFSTTLPQMVTLDIFSYAGSTNKTTLATYNGDKNGSGYVQNSVFLYRNTAAIDTILLYANTGNFNTGTTATLYGIKAA